MRNNKRSAGSVLIAAIVLLIAGKVLLKLLPLLAKLFFVLAALAFAGVIVLVVALVVSTLKGDGNETAGEKKTNADILRVNPKSGENSVKLKTADAQIVEAAMTCSRINDADIKKSAQEALISAEKIVSVLKEQKDEISKCHQFLNYYLPTLGVVLKKYKTIEDGKAGSGETKEQILSYLSDISKAMDRQYKNLFENEKLDMSVEMEAMQLAFKRDGLLTEADIPGNKEADITLVH